MARSAQQTGIVAVLTALLALAIGQLAC